MGKLDPFSEFIFCNNMLSNFSTGLVRKFFSLSEIINVNTVNIHLELQLLIASAQSQSVDFFSPYIWILNFAIHLEMEKQLNMSLFINLVILSLCKVKNIRQHSSL